VGRAQQLTHRCTDTCTKQINRRDKVPFHATLEDIYGAQAQYYDLPWLSYRNAMWRLAEQHQ
jgi:hypothetical protein